MLARVSYYVSTVVPKDWEHSPRGSPASRYKFVGNNHPHHSWTNPRAVWPLFYKLLSQCTRTYCWHFFRIVHAKGTGAYGVFEVTEDISAYTEADFLSQVGKKTKLFARFSTVVGEKGSADSVRDTRGFAFKLYTEKGNLDWLFFSTVSSYCLGLILQGWGL